MLQQGSNKIDDFTTAPQRILSTDLPSQFMVIYGLQNVFNNFPLYTSIA